MATWASEGAAGDGIAAEAAGLVAGLPVRLQQVVAHHVRDEEARQDRCPAHGFLALATYFLPARTITVFFFTKSRTDTLPRVTRVRVDVHLSSTSHLVPTTVAALCLPLVRNLPLPSPHRRRFFFLAAAIALPAFGQLSFSTSVSVVSGLAPLPCPSLKMPS